MLYMFEKLGECIARMKECGAQGFAGNPEVRCAFVTEMSDVFMYYLDTLLRFGVTAEELTDTYVKSTN